LGFDDLASLSGGTFEAEMAFIYNGSGHVC